MLTPDKQSACITLLREAAEVLSAKYRLRGIPDDLSRVADELQADLEGLDMDEFLDRRTEANMKARDTAYFRASPEEREEMVRDGRY